MVRPKATGLQRALPIQHREWAFGTASRAGVPVIRVRGGAFLAVQVCVNRHAIRGLQLIYQCVRTRPFALGIPPECKQWRSNAFRRNLACN